MRTSAFSALLLLSGVVTLSSCAMQDGDLMGRIFPVPTEKTITDVPHIPVNQLLEQETPFRRFRNPEELQAALGDAKVTAPTSVQSEVFPVSLLAKSYVYRVSDTGLSYAKLGDSQLPVRVMTLAFKPTGIALVDDTLVIVGAKQGSSATSVAMVDIAAPAAPRLVHTFEAEGTLQALRFAPHTIFIALRGQFQEPLTLPSMTLNGQKSVYDYTKPTCDCPSLYGFSRTYTNPGYLNVITLNVGSANLAPQQQIIALSADQQVTMTDTALYIAYKPQLTEDAVKLEVLKEALVSQLSAKAKVQYTQIVQAPDYVLSSAERQMKQLRFLEQQEMAMATDARASVDATLQQKMEQELKAFHDKIDITITHKLRFDENKLQYVTASQTGGTPFATMLLGETEKGTWLVSHVPTGTGALLHTLDGQMQPLGSLTLDGLTQPQVRRAKNNELWLGDLGGSDARVIDLADMTKPVLQATRGLVADARLVTVDDKRALQVNKNAQGITLTLLDTQGEPKQLATLNLNGSAAYTRFFENLGAALYMPAQKMLIIHMEESRGTGGKEHFDGVMVFAIGDTSIDKKAEFDLRSGMQDLGQGSDLSIVPMSDTQVAVLYGKTASLLDLVAGKEIIRRVLQ